MRRLAAVVAAAVLAAGLYVALQPRPAPARWNVLWLNADSLNRSRLSIYGNPRPTTPFLSTLAARGAVFDAMIHPSAWTNENLVSIHTALSSPTHRVETRRRSIDPAWTTPIDVLRAAGWRVPRLEGWRGDPNHDHLGFDDPTPMEPDAWLERHGRDGPFFLFYQFLYPHLPYNGDRRETDVQRSFFDDAMIRSPSQRRRLEATVLAQSVIPFGSVVFPPEDAEPIRALYDGEVLLWDRAVERTVRTLERLGLADSTIIVIGTDHGEELLEHGFIGHASTSHEARLHDEIVRVPFLIVLPPGHPLAAATRGVRIAPQVRGIDELPTLLDLLGLPARPEWEGRSMVPILRGEETADRPAFVQSSRAGYQEKDPANVTDRARAVRRPPWKLIRYDYQKGSRVELYRLDEDPNETRNVAAAETAVVADLDRRLLAWVLERETARPPPGEIRATWRQRLAAWWRGTRIRTDFTGVPSPPAPVKPLDGDVVTHATDGGRAVIRWTGAPDVPYVIEYDVGEGDYRLHGFLDVVGNEVVWGPFPRTYWETYLTLYNPYRARVSIAKEPREWSEWITFEVRPEAR